MKQTTETITGKFKNILEPRKIKIVFIDTKVRLLPIKLKGMATRIVP